MHSHDQLFRQALQQDHPYVVGLDFSLTSTGVYMLSLKPDTNHPDFYYHVPTTQKTGSDATRIDYISSMLIEDMRNPLYPVIAAAIEDYGPSGRTAGKILVRAELAGVVKNAIRNLISVPYYTVSPNGLKKFATGSGRTAKGQKSKDSMLHAAAMEGFETKVSDQADAFHAARFCKAVINGERVNVDYTRVNPKNFTFF